MKHLWQIIGGMALVMGLMFGAQQYLDARDSKAEMIAVRTLQGFERNQEIKTQMHLMEFYEMQLRYSTSPQERDKYQRKIDQTKEKIRQIGERR